MNGGTAYLDRVEIQIRNQQQKLHTVYIDIFDNSLSRKWIDALNHLLDNSYHLEKNYCFLGFEKSSRNINYLCNQINKSIQAINNSNIGYKIDDFFTPTNTITAGQVGENLPGMKINHTKFNQLHRYFEDLQGNSKKLSNFYKNANPSIRWHIRQLNLLCHECESWILSNRKSVTAPEWRRPSQLMCWLGAPRFVLDDNDLDQFGIERLHKPFGGVFVGVNKAVSKHHWEVFKDEGPDSKIDNLVTTSLSTQSEAAGDFDIEWGQSTHQFEFHTKQIAQFIDWLCANGFDPNDKNLTLGHPQIGQVDLNASFGTSDIDKVWNVLTNHLDVWKIKTSQSENTFDYHWSDDNYMQSQIDILGK